MRSICKESWLGGSRTQHEKTRSARTSLSAGPNIHLHDQNERIPDKTTAEVEYNRSLAKTVGSKSLSGIDQILELLIDEKWHSTRELATNLRFSEPRLREILRFLAEHGFVQYREWEWSVKIEPDLKKLIVG